MRNALVYHIHFITHIIEKEIQNMKLILPTRSMYMFRNIITMFLNMVYYSLMWICINLGNSTL